MFFYEKFLIEVFIFILVFAMCVGVGVLGWSVEGAAPLVLVSFIAGCILRILRNKLKK